MDNFPRRTPPRLRGFDYSSANGYFVTIRSSDRRPRFGEVCNGQLLLSPAGSMVVETWRSIPSQFPSVIIDEYIAMPDHFHGVLFLGVDPDSQFTERPKLGAVIQWFKTVTTNQYIRGVRHNDWPPFDKKLWQRYYNDHIVRNAADLDRIRAYITANPSRWSEKHDRS